MITYRRSRSSGGSLATYYCTLPAPVMVMPDIYFQSGRLIYSLIGGICSFARVTPCLAAAVLHCSRNSHCTALIFTVFLPLRDFAFPDTSGGARTASLCDLSPRALYVVLMETSPLLSKLYCFSHQCHCPRPPGVGNRSVQTAPACWSCHRWEACR